MRDPRTVTDWRGVLRETWGAVVLQGDYHVSRLPYIPRAAMNAELREAPLKSPTGVPCRLRGKRDHPVPLENRTAAESTPLKSL